MGEGGGGGGGGGGSEMGWEGRRGREGGVVVCIISQSLFLCELVPTCMHLTLSLVNFETNVLSF